MLACGSLSAWTAKDTQVPPDWGFSVNNHDRNDVVSFWYEIYLSSEGYDRKIGWTGSYNAPESSGTVSEMFRRDIERRINFFRALCGVPSDIEVNRSGVDPDTGDPFGLVLVDEGDPLDPADGDPFQPDPATTKQQAAQAAALMIALNYDRATGSNPANDHDPDPGPGYVATDPATSAIRFFSPESWNANSRSSLAFGVFGPGAMTEYILEELPGSVSAWNDLVGHRRWILNPEASNFGTGDTPGRLGPLMPDGTRPELRFPSNVLYVIQSEVEKYPDPAQGFVAYPAAGFFPAPINSKYWSLSMQGADFSAASVTMKTAAGAVVPVTLVKRDDPTDPLDTIYGDPAIIWVVPSFVASKKVYADTKFTVTISGIADPFPEDGVTVPSSHSYSVTLINPERILDNQSLSRLPKSTASQTTVRAAKSVKLSFKRPARAEAVSIAAYQRRVADWVEGAETTAKPRVIDQTDPAYPLVVLMSEKPKQFGALIGKRAFNLTFPRDFDFAKQGPPEQSFIVNRPFVPGKKAKVSFVYKRGLMSKASRLLVEVSSDGGVVWKTIGTINGVSDTNADVKISRASLTVASSGLPHLLRFRYVVANPGAGIFTHEAGPSWPTGIFLDEIELMNCDSLDLRKLNALPSSATAFTFSSKTAGAKLAPGQRWALAMRTKLGGHWFPDGPLKQLSVVE